MLQALKRHPIPVTAFFRHVLVLTYALPRGTLEQQLPRGLVVDGHGKFGFLAIAMVQTQALRPAFLPEIAGRDFFLAGYRVFARYRRTDGRTLRGLRILRSYADRRTMVLFGNLLTHYNYRWAEVNFRESHAHLEIKVETRDGEADLHVRADLSTKPAPLPDGSPFANIREARRFAGPLPFTFDYEEETNSMILIQGVRREWRPEPVAVEVLQNTFFERGPFPEVQPVLANAFHIAGVPYRWNRGIREMLPRV